MQHQLPNKSGGGASPKQLPDSGDEEGRGGDEEGEKLTEDEDSNRAVVEKKIGSRRSDPLLLADVLG
ncbi:unnamed protein product [Linum trigynum]|uniref:Uncharacterized protein n=1 Tax=Linum trigynum TaxID=586398 RepID=A0AAV2GQL2_9ROSI